MRYFWQRQMLPARDFPAKFVEADFQQFCKLIDTLERRRSLKRAQENPHWRE